MRLFLLLIFLQEIKQPLFIVNWHTSLFRFREFRASILTNNQVTQRFANTRSDSASQFDQSFFSRRTGHFLQTPGEQERLTRKRTINGLLFFHNVQPGLFETLNQFTVLVVLEPVVDALTTDWANAGDISNLILASGN